MERVAPRNLNYDDVLPLAISSRAQRRQFASTNGSEFSNTTGATICKVDVNADSMLDAGHSYLSMTLTNQTGTAHTFLMCDIGCPWIQRLVISSGGVVIEDINEYGRLYAAMLLNQTSEDYARNVCGAYGLVGVVGTSAVQAGSLTLHPLGDGAGHAHAASVGGWSSGGEIGYIPTACSLGAGITAAGVRPTDNAGHHPTADGLLVYARDTGAIAKDGSRTIVLPLLSGFLNMDKYIPLIMMNAGFTIEIHLAAANKIGCSVTQQNDAKHSDTLVDSLWKLSNVKYNAQLIDLDASFYGKLRGVMDASGGVLQLAGQTYRHYAGQLGSGASEYSITLPARVKSIKSIFGAFIDANQVNSKTSYGTSVFQNGALTQFRFEIGSVRYPQTDVKMNGFSKSEVVAELHKAFGRLGDYAHSSCVRPKHLFNIQTAVSPISAGSSGLAGFLIGYDFEAFQRVALESGINTADRSLPVNFICSKTATTNATQCDFYVLSDAIYYIQSDGTVSVSV